MSKIRLLIRALTVLLVIFVNLSAGEVFADFDKLTKKTYDESKNKNAVVVYGVNWGRQWGCSRLDNAQLQSLTFSRIDSESYSFDGENIVLKSPLKLFTKDASQSYAIIVSPGEYAFTGFDIKVSNSSREVGHVKGESRDLFKNGKPVGGTFQVNAGEVVYIGDFGLDCAGEPIPWRYYIQKEDFGRYVDLIFPRKSGHFEELVIG